MGNARVRYIISVGPDSGDMERLERALIDPHNGRRAVFQIRDPETGQLFGRTFQVTRVRVAEDGLRYEMVAKGPGKTTLKGCYDPDRIGNEMGFWEALVSEE